MNNQMSRSRLDMGRTINLTAVVGSPKDLCDKLHWNWERYHDELDHSTDGRSVGFAALDYAKTAIALHDWVNLIITQRNRSDGTEIAKLVDDDIRWQGAIRAVANAAKHGRFDDKAWPGGWATMGIVAPDELRGQVHTNRALTPVLLKDGARWEFILTDPYTSEHTQAGDAFLENFIDWDGILVELKTD